MSFENEVATVFASAVRGDTVNSDDQTNKQAAGVIVTIDMTAVPTIKTVTFTIQGKDPTSGKYYDILASAAVVAVSTVTLTVYPTIAAVANVSAAQALPRVWRVKTVFSAAGNFTFSVGASYLLG